MDDQDKKGYDEFFSSEGSNRSQEGDRSEEERRSDGVEEARQNQQEQHAKPSYYYSYGPMSQQPNQTVASQSGSQSSYDSGYPSAVPAPSIEAASSEPRNYASAQAVSKPNFKVREQRRTSFRAMFLSFLVGVLVVGGLMYTADYQNWFTHGDSVATQTKNDGGSVSASTASGANSSTNALVADRPDNLADLFEKSSPAVVKIETYVNAQSRQNSGSILDDPFFRQFFGDNYPGTGQQQQPNNGDDSQMQELGIGSGFFYKSDGYILTNQHVIANADQIKVVVQGYDEPIVAKLLGSSYDLDLAVLKVEGDQAFPTLPLGSSDDINIGDWVVAIGNPYGFDHTITAGVLSAKERPIDIQDSDGERQYKHLLQTDASINPGNSGGPLLNVNGEVVGINTAVSSQAQGIGFAIPTSTINEVLDSLTNNTEIPKEPAPFIGAELYAMTEDYAKQLGLDSADGSLVKGVYYNSPAYLADLKQYDVITGIDGKEMKTTDALIAAIQEHKVGDKVELNIYRNGQKMNIEVEIGDKNTFGITE
ncbi:trypsin-like peptidase domain-containing protein [Paenibacillus sp. HB172176]|uniref:S1C family serine protease n=1 Tax=Paenibacillus sp. HB172176 TaxID=2493690 RepID=UPI00143B1254|nr:trypsin-like peptidase domain-containing protein [Paenibacillus sp. HB172176]